MVEDISTLVNRYQEAQVIYAEARAAHWVYSGQQRQRRLDELRDRERQMEAYWVEESQPR